MNSQFDDPTNLYDAWEKFSEFSRKLIKRTIGAEIVLFIVLYFFTCNTADGQERAVLVSSVKIPFSTYYKVTVSDSCNVYETKWNSHCWKCTESEIPKSWTVIKTSKGKYFIKHQL